MSAVPATVPAMPAKPQPDKAAMRAALAALYGPDDVIELRSFARGKKRTDAGYFDGEHREAMIDAAARLNAQGAAVYMTLNRIDPRLLGRYHNRIEPWAADTATDANVIRRRWLLLDFDPVRPKNTAATEAQVALAKERAGACNRMLKAEGWPEPLAGPSGNGWHLLYPLDLPNDAESTALLKGALAGLAARHDDKDVQVDQAVFNAARITKFYGTVATKGDHTALAPWRLSRLVSTPARGAPATLGQLRALQPAPAADPKATGLAASSHFDLTAFMSRLGLGYEHDRHEGRDRYRLVHCPFNEAHGKGEAAIFRDADGKLGFKCQHDSCADKRWQDVRALVDGPRETRSARQVQSVGSSQASPEPKPLPNELPPVEAFPPAALPEAFRPWAGDVAQRMNCPLDFVALPIVVAAASLVARHVGIRPQARTDWTERANLWGLIVGPPGIMKSPAMAQALAPIERLEARAAEAYRNALDSFMEAAPLRKLRTEAGMKAARAALTKNAKADVSDLLRREANEDEPIRRRYLVSDATYEKLGEIIVSNPGGVLSARDEMRGLFMHLAREESATARGFYLQAWSGGRYPFDRIGRGTVMVDDARLSMIGGIQPGPLSDLMLQARRGAADDGMIERFLISWPDSPGAWRDVDRWPDSAAKRKAWEVFERLDSITADGLRAEVETDLDGAPTGLPFLRFADDAREAFLEWRTDLEAKLRNAGAEGLEGALSKFRHHVPALALVLHVVDGGVGPVTMAPTTRALALADYFESHARRLHASGRRVAVRSGKAILGKVRDGSLSNPFTARDVYRNQWAGLGDRAIVADALDLLVAHDWLLETTADTGGRPTALYSLTEGARHG